MSDEELKELYLARRRANDFGDFPETSLESQMDKQTEEEDEEKYAGFRDSSVTQEELEDAEALQEQGEEEDEEEETGYDQGEES
mmetsp:Transcript_5002/g.11997  ORF Transcript_5002/g.11997 Transcript_5002/m.11997 type:complete len:84 (-) Transcript_5002:57-308(-)